MDSISKRLEAQRLYLKATRLEAEGLHMEAVELYMKAYSLDPELEQEMEQENEAKPERILKPVCRYDNCFDLVRIIFG